MCEALNSMIRFVKSCNTTYYRLYQHLVHPDPLASWRHSQHSLPSELTRWHHCLQQSQFHACQTYNTYIYVYISHFLPLVDCTNPWCTLVPWTPGDIPNKHFSLESSDGITVYNGASFISGVVSQYQMVLLITHFIRYFMLSISNHEASTL